MGSAVVFEDGGYTYKIDNALIVDSIKSLIPALDLRLLYMPHICATWNYKLNCLSTTAAMVAAWCGLSAAVLVIVLCHIMALVACIECARGSRYGDFSIAVTRDKKIIIKCESTLFNIITSCGGVITMRRH